jgi:hypothetical protein
LIFLHVWFSRYPARLSVDGFVEGKRELGTLKIDGIWQTVQKTPAVQQKCTKFLTEMMGPCSLLKIRLIFLNVSVLELARD